MKKVDPNLTYPDDTPVEIPVRLRKAALEGDRFKDLVQRFSQMQAERGNESLEEADDFDVEDDADIDFVSPHELTEMQEEGSMRDASFEAKRERYYGPRKSVKRVEGAGRVGDEDQPGGEPGQKVAGADSAKKEGVDRRKGGE